MRPRLFLLPMFLWLLPACPHEEKPEETADTADTSAVENPNDVDQDGDGVSYNEGDCDDTDATVYPGATETCNGVDDDCDGIADVGATDTQSWYRDDDEDGYGGTNSLVACSPPEGYVAQGGDCNDRDDAIHPDADELCNDLDDDCDGEIDEDPVGGEGSVTWYLDADDDEYGDPDETVVTCDNDRPSSEDGTYVTLGGDCDDSDNWVHPGVDYDTCNGVDDDCDGETDEDPEYGLGAVAYFSDGDGDGYGQSEVYEIVCADDSIPDGYANNPDDCDDHDPDVYPFAPETCDGVDDDCDGAVDELYDPWWGDVVLFGDADEDGYGSDIADACDMSVADNDLDCDDADDAVNPDATETCDGIDDDCDGETDEDDASDAATWYKDRDEDGYGDPTSSTTACEEPDGYVDDDTDCNDRNEDINPAAAEIPLNGKDDDCDGAVDEASLRR